MLKTLKCGEVIRKKTTSNPFLVIRIFEHGWFVVDLLSADDPAIPKLILPRNYDSWVRDTDILDKDIKVKVWYEENTWSYLH